MKRIIKQAANGRLTLGAEHANKTFLAHQEPGGRIVLTPVAVVPEEKK